MITHRKIAPFGAAATLSISLISATTIPAAFAADPAPATAAATGASTSHTYDDGATISFPDTWTKGQALTFTGTGFKAKDGSGSVLAIKINGGAVNGQPYLRVEADANGNVSGSIPWQDNLKAGDKVEINVLTGSFKEGDVRRGGTTATVTITEGSSIPDDSSSPAPSATPTPTPTPAQPSASPTATESVTPQPSASATESASTHTEQPSSPAPSPSSSESAPAPSATASAKASSTPTNEADILAPVVEPSATPRFRNCRDVEDAGLAPIHRDHPDFQEKFDSDHDGVGCELPADYQNDSSRVEANLAATDNNNGSSAQLASTGANGVMSASGMGLIALGIGSAAIMVMRNRKKVS